MNSDFDSFYVRRLKTRIDDCFSQPVTGVAGRTITIFDRKTDNYNLTQEFSGTKSRTLNISSYNYLGFAQARGGCADAVEESLQRYGVSSLGARLEGGSSDFHLLAESLVARFVGMESSLISSMGFATNSTFIPALVGKGCLVISDELNHASIRVGTRFSGASVRMFKHNDMAALESLLREVISQGQPKTHRPWKKILIIVEGLYSMEGTLVNLPAIMALKKKYKVCNHSCSIIHGIDSVVHSSAYSSMRPTRLVLSALTVVVCATTSVSTRAMSISLWALSPNHSAQQVVMSLATRLSSTLSASTVTLVLTLRRCRLLSLPKSSHPWPASWA